MNTQTLRRTILVTGSLALALWSQSSGFAAGSVTNNAVGTVNWQCPPGVTSIKVECWGGGGAGGAADYSGTATAGTINVAGGGGAGGAYARKDSVPVTPGNIYVLTIPAAAVGAPAGTGNGVPGETGGTVTFTGDAATVVTAVGGAGGASRVSTTTATGAGGTGSTAGCVGDVVFAGGSCTVSLTSGTCGGGGGGAGDTNPGGNTANNVGGAGGIAGGGVGGTGPTGGNNGNSGGQPGVAGGGSGGREQRTTNAAKAGGNGGLGQIIITYSDGGSSNAPGLKVVSLTASNATVAFPGLAGVNYSFQRATNATFTLGVANFPPVIAPASGWVTNVDDFADLFGVPNAATPAAAFYRVRTNPPMNVVLFLADDWRYDTLGVAGDPTVLTPRLDTLAGEGMRFTRACVTSPVCWVSRASIYTGQWLSRNNNAISPWNESYLGLLRANGYWTGHVGKWHNGNFPTNNFDFGRSYFGKHWYNINGQQIHVTQRNENDSLDFLRTRPAGKPFYLTVAYFAAHAEDSNPLQYLPQPEFTNLYVNATVPVPVNATDESFNRLPPFIAHEQNEGRIRWHWRFDEPAKFQTMMKNYYRLCSGVDAACGRIMDELQAQGVLDNTLIIFIGDNGYFHAEHGLADKWYPHQESIRVPLIVRDPRMAPAQRGQTNDDFALNVDLAPTILAAAGIPAPTRMQGRDLAPLYLGQPNPPWRTEFFEEHEIITSTNRIPASQALVRKDFKYMYWPDFDTEQLFDLIADPLEENDVVNDPAQQARLAEMRQRFAELKAAAK